MHQKRYKNGNLKKNHTKYSKLIFICSIHKHTCEFQHLSTLRYAKNVFIFGGSLSNYGLRVPIFIGICFALQIGVVVLVFRFLFCIFLQCPFLYHGTWTVRLYDLYVVRKKKCKLFAKLLMINPCVIKKYIINVTYVVNDNRLGCFVFEKQSNTGTIPQCDACTAVHRLFDQLSRYIILKKMQTC